MAVSRWSDLKLTGELGHLTLAELELDLDSKSIVKASTVDIQKLSLDALAEALRIKGIRGVVKKMGYLSGVLDLRSLSDFRFQGDIQDLGIIFSRQRQKYLEVIEKIPLRFSRDDQKVSLTVTNPKPREGQCEGVIEIESASGGEDWLGRVNLSQLQFSPAVQKLMVGGEISPSRLQGTFRGTSKGLESFRGVVRVPSVKGHSVHVDQWISEVKYENDQWNLEMTAPYVEYFPKDRWSFLVTLFLQKNKQQENWLKLSKAYLRGHIKEEVFHWDYFRIQLQDQPMELQSSGHIGRSGQLDSSLSLKVPSLGRMDWNVAGTLKQPDFRPTSLTARQSVLSMKPSEESSYQSWLKNLKDLTQTGAQELKEIGQRVLKDLLPEKKE